MIPLEETIRLIRETQTTDHAGGDREDYWTFLYKCVERLVPDRGFCLEIGTYRGSGTIAMAGAAKDRGIRIVTCDPVLETGTYYCNDAHNPDGHTFESSLREIDDRFFQCGVFNHILTVPFSSERLFEEWRGIDLSFVIIDGEHTYDAIQKDMRWAKFLKVGGYIALDDWIHDVELSCKDYLARNPGYNIIYEASWPHRDWLNTTLIQRVS